ncbi:MAG: NAD(P)-binding protein [Phascolarctobacterium sp.]|nr:NAD(P)-binding protein [Phascolarctobacterium sp.]
MWAGPAGLLCALELAKYGYGPLLLERGKPIAGRVEDVRRFWKQVLLILHRTSSSGKEVRELFMMGS